MRRHRFVAALVLAIGWSAAAAVYVRSAPAPDIDPEVAAEVYDMEHSKRHARDLEQIGGKAALFTAELNDAVASLLSGRALACSIAVLTAAAAGAYLLVARLASRGEGRRRGAGG